MHSLVATLPSVCHDPSSSRIRGTEQACSRLPQVYPTACRGLSSPDVFPSSPVCLSRLLAGRSQRLKFSNCRSSIQPLSSTANVPAITHPYSLPPPQKSAGTGKDKKATGPPVLIACVFGVTLDCRNPILTAATESWAQLGAGKRLSVEGPSS